MDLDKLTWYVSRSGGIVSWGLLALSLILGLLLSSRILGRKVSPAWTLSVHRFLGGLSVLFTAVHVAAIMLDEFVSFGVADVLVPWAASWQPTAVAWGIVAMYLMVAIELTSFVMNRLPKKLWRGVHWLSAPLFGFATLHGYQAGSDAGRAFIIAILGVMAVLVVLTVVRVVRSRRASEPRTDPRTLLAQAKERPAMRAEPPVHVLDALTLSPLTPEVPVIEEREFVPAGSGEGRPPTFAEQETVQTRQPPPKSRRRAPTAPCTLEEALPPVPWAPPEPSPLAEIPPPDPWPEPFFGTQADEPASQPVAHSAHTSQSVPFEPEPVPPTPPRVPEPAPSARAEPEPSEESREPVMSGAPLAYPPSGIEPPRPAWDNEPR